MRPNRAEINSNVRGNKNSVPPIFTVSVFTSRCFTSSCFMFQLAKLTLTWPCSRRNMTLIPSAVSWFLLCRSVYQLAYNQVCLMDAPFYSFPSLKSDSWPNYFHLSGADLHLVLHRIEEDGLPAGAQPSDRGRALVSWPDGSRSFLYPALGCHWNHVLHPGGGNSFTQLQNNIYVSFL